MPTMNLIGWQVLLGDSGQLPLGDCSVDAVVTDPPYGLKFMGKAWDYDVPGVELWREVLRVLKPGGHVLAFFGTRTYHRGVVAMEDAGFEVRDQISFLYSTNETMRQLVATMTPEQLKLMDATFGRDSMVGWYYGSGFPKSLDVSKAIDKAAGAEREVVGKRRFADGTLARDGAVMGQHGRYNGAAGCPVVSAPATPEAHQWEGWGTALKPAMEPIVVARKPLIGTVAKNVLEHGTGALNIDGCRAGTETRTYKGSGAQPHKLNAHGKGDTGIGYMDGSGRDNEYTATGRWPANVILSHLEGCRCVGTKKVYTGPGGPVVKKNSSKSGNKSQSIGEESRAYGTEMISHRDLDGTETVESWECVEGCPVKLLDEQTGILKSGANPKKRLASMGFHGSQGQESCHAPRGEDRGGASRFFYCAKASRSERNAGLDGMPTQAKPLMGEFKDNPGRSTPKSSPTPRANHHPTVKPIALMRYLCRLITPPGGIILDPFCGSGSTGIAAVLEDFNFLGVDLNPDYVKLAKHRLQHWAPHEEPAPQVASEPKVAKGQTTLF